MACNLIEFQVHLNSSLITAIEITLYLGQRYCILNFSEYCNADIFNPSCENGEVNVVTQARYGRMKLGRCVKRDYGSLGCSTELLQLMDNKCSGLNSCTVPIIELQGVVNLPCIGDLRANLEASYVCYKGEFYVKFIYELDNIK